MSTWRVADGTQVHHDGVTYGSGETFDATADDVSLWLGAGWVVKVEASKPKAPRREAK